MTVQNWASRPLDANVSMTIDGLRERIPVAMIATLGDDLVAMDETMDAATSPELASFDYVPVKRNGHVCGVFCRDKGMIVSLDETMLLPPTASLLDFLEEADTFPYALIVEDRKVIGIVTLSDLQKLPVSTVLFTLLICVEMLLVEWIRRRCSKCPDEWLTRLASSDQKQIRKLYKRAKEKNVALDELTCASFYQAITAAHALGLSDERKEQLLNLKELRNYVCHAMDFAQDLEGAAALPKMTKLAMKMIDDFEADLGRRKAGC